MTRQNTKVKKDYAQCGTAAEIKHWILNTIQGGKGEADTSETRDAKR